MEMLTNWDLNREQEIVFEVRGVQSIDSMVRQ